MLATTILSLALAAQAAPLGEAELASAFGNTLLSTYPDGRTARLWLQAGGRYEGQGRRGVRDMSSGVWRVREGQVCFSQRRPIPIPGSYCMPIVRARIGQSWSGRAVTGETIRITLMSGR